MIDASIKIHRELGSGLLESVYETVLARVLARRGLVVERQKAGAFDYDGMPPREPTMNEAETRAENIDPAVEAAGGGWSKIAKSSARQLGDKSRVLAIPGRDECVDLVTRNRTPWRALLRQRCGFPRGGALCLRKSDDTAVVRPWCDGRALGAG